MISSESDKTEAVEPNRFSMDSFFLVKESVIDEEYCDSILNQYKNVEQLSRKNKRIVEGVEKVIDELYITNQLGEYWGGLEDNITNALKPYVSDYLKTFGTIELQNFEFNGVVLWSQKEMDYSPLHYDKEWLQDSSGEFQARNFLCLLYLDDNYDGGEIIFPLQGKVIKPKKGMLLIFPTSYMFPHNTTPVLGGERHLLRLTMTFKKDTLKTSFFEESH